MSRDSATNVSVSCVQYIFYDEVWPETSWRRLVIGRREEKMGMVGGSELLNHRGGILGP